MREVPRKLTEAAVERCRELGLSSHLAGHLARFAFDVLEPLPKAEGKACKRCGGKLAPFKYTGKVHDSWACQGCKLIFDMDNELFAAVVGI